MVRFPAVGWPCDFNAIRIDRPGIAHAGDIQILPDIGVAFPAGPYKIQLTACLQHRAVNGPFVRRVRNLTFVLPGSCVGSADVFSMTYMRWLTLSPSSLA